MSRGWTAARRPTPGRPSALHADVPSLTFRLHAALCIGNGLHLGGNGWCYHRLTASSMLMKPGFLRSSQYMLLETHRSL